MRELLDHQIILLKDKIVQKYLITSSNNISTSSPTLVTDLPSFFRTPDAQVEWFSGGVKIGAATKQEKMSTIIRSHEHGSGIDGILHRAVERITGKFIISYTFPDTPTLTIEDVGINLKLKLKNSTVSRTNFTVDYVRSNLVDLWAKYHVFAPESTISGTYKINGIAFGKKIIGSGNFTSRLSDLGHNGFIQMEIANGGMQISLMQLDYTLDSFQHNITGLTVDGFEGERSNEFLKSELWPWLETNKGSVGRNVGHLVKDIGNNVIKGKTLAEIVYMIKYFAHHF